MVHSSLLVLFASWMLMHSAGCAQPQTIDCALDEQLSADGRRCELIQCEGGEIENKECVCPANQVLDSDRCLAEDDPCIGFSCNDGNECTDDTCVAVGTEATCPFSPVNDGSECDGGAGVCTNGSCETPPELCGEVDCDDQNPCTVDGVCDAETNTCPQKTFEPVDTVCNGDGVCDNEGNCVECTRSGDQCSDANECTNNVCTEGVCSNPDSDGGPCDRMPGEGVCMDGMCEQIPPVCQVVTCDDGKDCTQNICMDVEGMGTCSYPSEPDGSPCTDDGNECTTNSCAGGTCAATPVSDGTPCNGGADECAAGLCVERKWGTPQRIETDNPFGAFNPQLAFDPNGNAVAVWHQADGIPRDIWANRYTPSNGWGTAERIEDNDLGGAGKHQVAIDANGNALAVWSQWDGTRTNIWSNRYTPSGGWSTPERVENNDAGETQDPQVAIDASANALAVWQESDGKRINIWANRYTPSGGWGTARLIETNDAGDALKPQVAIDPSGKALAVWSQSDGTRTNIWANRYTPIVRWVTAELIETDDTGDALNPQVAIDPRGNALAVWSQSNGTRINIWSNRYAPSSGWATAELIEANDAGDAGNPQVVIDPSGNALAVWEQFDGMRQSIWANRYTPSDRWGTAGPIEDDDAGNASEPQVAIDPRGNALAVWRQTDGPRQNVWANRYTPSRGWATAGPIEDDVGAALTPQVAIDPSGNAIAVWGQSDGTRDNIWANRFE